MTYPFLYIAALFLPPAPSPADERAIAEQIVRLGNNRFAVREQAAKKLEAFGTVARVPLMRACRAKDAETANRAAAIFGRIVDAECNGLWPWPFADAAWWDTAARSYSQPRCPVLVAHLDAVGRDGRPWHHYRLATGAWVRERLAAGVGVRGMRLILAEMHRRDASFIGTTTARADEDDPPQVVDWEEYLAGSK